MKERRPKPLRPAEKTAAGEQTAFRWGLFPSRSLAPRMAESAHHLPWLGPLFRFHHHRSNNRRCANTVWRHSRLKLSALKSMYQNEYGCQFMFSLTA